MLLGATGGKLDRPVYSLARCPLLFDSFYLFSLYLRLSFYFNASDNVISQTGVLTSGAESCLYIYR